VLFCALTGLIALGGSIDVHGQVTAGRLGVVFEPREPYRLAVDAAVTSLRAAGHECDLIELPLGDEAALQVALKQLADAKPTVLLAAGPTAASRALETCADVPVVFCMVPNALDAAFLASDSAARRRVAGVSSDIDPTEQVEWIIRTYPRAKKVGVLHSARTAKTAASLGEAGQKRGLDVRTIPANRDEFPQAIDALDRQGCDSVLMIPDAQVFNSANVERLLLWGLRQKKPLWTFSENVVKAGAFSGLYCDSAAVGRQAAGVVEEVVRGKAPTAIGLRYPQTVRRAVNVHTAEMIEAPLDEQVFTSGVVRLGESP
jgi:putative ABC transport system substrate-binding protein